jgi:hypothetical protein
VTAPEPIQQKRCFFGAIWPKTAHFPWLQCLETEKHWLRAGKVSRSGASMSGVTASVFAVE